MIAESMSTDTVSFFLSTREIKEINVQEPPTQYNVTLGKNSFGQIQLKILVYFKPLKRLSF